VETLESYTNQKGETFSIFFDEPPLPKEATYWGFFYRVTDSKKRSRVFRFVVKKSFIADFERAKNLRLGLPLEALHGLLELVEDGSMPLFLPDCTKGWEVY
jgi:hypothetical protein